MQFKRSLYPVASGFKVPVHNTYALGNLSTRKDIHLPAPNEDFGASSWYPGHEKVITFHSTPPTKSSTPVPAQKPW